MSSSGRKVFLAALLAACGPDPQATLETPAGEAPPERGFASPVATNAEQPVRYPPDLFSLKVEGTVVLRLFIDETGTIVPDSTRIAEGSGYLALDSAALAAVPDMRFAPALRDGLPVATGFLQPVHFRHPEGAGPGGEL